MTDETRIPFDLERIKNGDPFYFLYNDDQEMIAKLVYISKSNGDQKYLVISNFSTHEQCCWLRESEIFMMPKKKFLYIGIERGLKTSLVDGHIFYRTSDAYEDVKVLKNFLDLDYYKIQEIEIEE